MQQGFMITRMSGFGAKFYLLATHPPTWSTEKANVIVWDSEADARKYLTSQARGSEARIEPVRIDAVPLLTRQPMTEARCRQLQEASATVLQGFLRLAGDVRDHAVSHRRDAALEALVDSAVSSCAAELEFLRFETEQIG